MLDKLVVFLRIDLVNIIVELKSLIKLILTYFSILDVQVIFAGDVSIQPVEKIICDDTSSSHFKIIKRHETELK